MTTIELCHLCEAESVPGTTHHDLPVCRVCDELSLRPFAESPPCSGGEADRHLAIAISRFARFMGFAATAAENAEVAQWFVDAITKTTKPTE